MHQADEPPPDGSAAPAAPSEARAAHMSAADHADDPADGWSSARRVVIMLIVAFIVLAPFFSKPRPSAAQIAFLAPAAAALFLYFGRMVAVSAPQRGRAATASLFIIVGLGLSILVVGGLDWVGALFIAAAAAGRLAGSVRIATVGAFCCAAGALGFGLSQHATYGSRLGLTLGPLLAAFFAYSAARRLELVSKLRETQAELARMAVADERLRIARDLHDLLGHSLSLITLKAELAGRVIDADPGRASREIADVEDVARRSLSEVRAVVTSYRQPSLAGELAAARQMLAAAGMDCQVLVPSDVQLLPDTDALLAWTVREGATNAVRHSGARTVTITVTATAAEVTAEVADDGVGPTWDPDRGPGALGSGLAGLTERASNAGGEISAGKGPAGKGFRLLVRVPPS
jgi:two-component system sensor histidine kinase DesK